jgi:hypothetical protein
MTTLISSIGKAITTLIDWLRTFLSWLLGDFLNKAWDLIIEVVQSIIDSFGMLADLCLVVLPDLSSFCADCIPDITVEVASANSLISTGLFGLARWVLPIDAAICVAAIMATTLLLYFTIAPVLRWAKILN